MSLNLNTLNNEQLQAVTTIEGPVLIIAGAGSGKTKALTYRIAYLIEQGIAPDAILALTFTNKAAGEMKERVAGLVSHRMAQRVWAGTFHSVFARILRDEADKLGYSKNFTIYDTEDSLGQIRKILKEANISDQKFTPNAVKNKISWAKNSLISWQAFSQTANTFIEKHISEIYQEYETRLIKSNAMDFDDLLVNMIKLFKSSPDSLKRYQEKFNYIMVDEYQDTNKPQYQIVKALAALNRNVCVVGDDAQSIYGWRGADIKNILDFQKDFPESKVVKLEQNYRSTKNILGAADSVIKNNRGQLPKTLWTDNEAGELIQVYEEYDDREEADKVGKIVRELINEGFKSEDIALLYRTNSQSQQLEDALRREAIPYTIVSGLSFYRRKEIKDSLAYLRLLVNQQDSESVVRALSSQNRGLGETSLSKISMFASENNISFFDALGYSEKIASLPKKAIGAAIEFYALIKKYAELAYQLPPYNLASLFIKETGLIRMYEQEKTDEALDRIDNIERLLSDIADYEQREENPNLEDYLSQVSLLSDVDATKSDTPSVSLMTIHASKGLEFPAVIISGLEQGLFPSIRQDTTAKDIEEERRLFYVAVTRAEKRLFLCFAKNRMRFGEKTASRRSEFLDEVSPQYMKWENEGETSHFAPAKGSKSSVSTNFSATYSASKSTNQSSSGYSVGDKVRHAIFGDGKIDSMSGMGPSALVIVNFETAGKKKLMLQYAKLQKVK